MLCEIIYKQNMSVYVDQQVYIHDVIVWWNERHYIPLGIHFHENKYSSGMKIECSYFIDTTSHPKWIHWFDKSYKSSWICRSFPANGLDVMYIY